MITKSTNYKFSNLHADINRIIISNFLTPVARLINRATRRHLSFCKQFAEICKLYDLVAFEPEHYELDKLGSSTPVVPIRSAFVNKEMYPFQFQQKYDASGNCAIIIRPLVVFEWSSESYGYYHPSVFHNEILFLIDKDMETFITEIKKELYALKHKEHILPENGVDNNIYLQIPTDSKEISYVPFKDMRNTDLLTKEKILFSVTSTHCKIDFELRRCNRVCVCFHWSLFEFEIELSVCLFPLVPV